MSQEDSVALCPRCAQGDHDEAPALRAEIARLREALTMEGVMWLRAFHAYGCPYWRGGKSHGPCSCGGVERQDRLDELLEVRG
jgi:hypothetical protein